MLTVTESALDNLAKAIGRIEDPKPDNVCFRVVPDDGGKLVLTVGVPTPDDTEYEHNGVTVLALSGEMREICEELTLDSDDSGNFLLR